MDENKFWEIIESAHRESGNDMERKSASLQRTLATLLGAEAVRFSEIFDGKMDHAYTHALWGSAYLIHGGCSDDTFSDFRASLISRGKELYDAAVADPDSLANDEFNEDAWFYEGYEYAVTKAIAESIESTPPRKTVSPNEPTGEPWAENSETLRNVYPKLWVQFGRDWEAAEIAVPSSRKPCWKFW